MRLASPERASLKARLASMAGEHVDIPLVDQRQGVRTGDRAVVMPHDHAHVLGTSTRRRRNWCTTAIAAARAARERMGQLGLGGPRRRVPARPPSCSRRPGATRSTPRPCSASARRLPGRDRRGCELIDFLRFNVAFAAGPDGRAAGQRPRRVEPDRLPRARRLRLRRHAVQLHRDRRQPADRAGADGQHRGLEAGRQRDAERLLHDEAARGRGPAARASSTSCPATR